MKNQKPDFECPFEIGQIYKLTGDHVLNGLIVLILKIEALIYKEQFAGYTVDYLIEDRISSLIYHRQSGLFNNLEKYFEKVVDKQ